MKRFLTITVTAFSVAATAACGRKDTQTVDSTSAAAPAPVPMSVTPSVSTIEVGKRLDANNRVTGSMTTFSPRDTLYAVVVTENAPAGTSLTARWTFGGTGQVVDSTTQAVAASSTGSTTTVTEFHISKPGGWPAGRYRVEILMNGTPAGSREFEVTG